MTTTRDELRRSAQETTTEDDYGIHARWWAGRVLALLDQLDQAEARIKAVRDLHGQSWNGTLDYCRRCIDYEGAIWPCATIRALEA